MEIPLKITFRDMPPSKAIENNIRERGGEIGIAARRHYRLPSQP